MVDWTVSWKPSYVCQERNMRALAFWLKFPGLFSVLSFQLLRYSRNSIKNCNLWKMSKKKIYCLKIDLIDYCRKKRQIPQYWLILSNRLIKPQKYITDLNPKKYRRCKFSVHCQSPCLTFLVLHAFQTMLVQAVRTSASAPVMLTLSALDLSLTPGHSGVQALKTYFPLLFVHCLHIQLMLCTHNKLLLVPV